MNRWVQKRLTSVDKNTLSKISAYLPYISIIVGSIIGFLSGIYSTGILFYSFSALGLCIALLGELFSFLIEKYIENITEKELLKKKHTPPKFIINLKYKDIKSYLVLIQSENLIPFEFKVSILNDQNVFLSDIQIDWAQIYPQETARNFNYAVSLNNNPPNIIKLKFDYKSVWAGEINKQELSGCLTQRYKVNSSGLIFLDQA